MAVKAVKKVEKGKAQKGKKNTKNIPEKKEETPVLNSDKKKKKDRMRREINSDVPITVTKETLLSAAENKNINDLIQYATKIETGLLKDAIKIYEDFYEKELETSAFIFNFIQSSRERRSKKGNAAEIFTMEI